MPPLYTHEHMLEHANDIASVDYMCDHIDTEILCEMVLQLLNEVTEARKVLSDIANRTIMYRDTNNTATVLGGDDIDQSNLVCTGD